MQHLSLHQNAVWKCGPVEPVHSLEKATETRKFHLTATSPPPLHPLVLGGTKHFIQSFRLLQALDPYGDQNNEYFA